MSKAVGIYNVFGVEGESKIIINHKETVYPKEGEMINDIMVERYNIIDSVVGEIFVCNLVDGFLLSSKTLPVLYVNVVYQKPLRSVLLYRIYLLFEIEDDIKSAEDLIGNFINGKFRIEIFINNENKVIDDGIEAYIGNEATYKKFMEFTMTDGMKEIIGAMVEEVVQKLAEQYKDEGMSFEVPENIISLKNYEVDD